MKLSSQIKPISYLKAHAAEIVRNLKENPEPLVITQNGEAKAVLQDIESYEQTGIIENSGAWYATDRSGKGSTSCRGFQAPP